LGRWRQGIGYMVNVPFSMTTARVRSDEGPFRP
jgi:hypothetical protein